MVAGVGFMLATTASSSIALADDSPSARSGFRDSITPLAAPVAVPPVPPIVPLDAYGFPVDRNELIVVPAFGGDSDIGVEFGATLSIAHFRRGYRPYAWRMVAVASMSVKDDFRGPQAVQQYQGVRFDFPNFFSPILRLDLRLNFLRAVDYVWYGVGNQTTKDVAPPPPGASSSNEYLEENVRVRSLLRIKTGTLVEVAFSSNLRYESPEVYSGSKLANDVADTAIVGNKPALLETLGEGFIIDTRDNEFVPHQGMFWQVGVGETLGSAQRVRYGEVSAVLSQYAPLARSLTFASRMIASYEWGTIPFYDLETGGVFDPLILIGGYRGVRGIPSGRFAGPIKVANNNELRFTPIPRFNVLRWSLRIGMTGFFDAGRVFSEFAYPGADDGHTLGLKVSTGGGFFFQWDEASVFRVEAAYSPEYPTVSGLPVSLYFENGLLF